LRALATESSDGRQPDERLLIEAAQRDPLRFAELYENNFDRVYAYIAYRVRNREEAEDLTAEVFHQALKNLGKFEWRGVPFEAWLVRIAAHAIADRRHRAAREQGLPEDADFEAATGGDEIERRALLAQLVETLPSDQRHVVIRRFVEQRSISDIARELGRTEGAVKQLQFRALQSLRTRIQRSPNGPDRGHHD
jgi:RNA polymerase sigma-70 factor (ECF subfamily)